MKSREKHFTDPCTGDCGVARFIRVKGSPCVPSLSVPSWKKFNHVFSKDKSKPVSILGPVAY